MTSRTTVSRAVTLSRGRIPQERCTLLLHARTGCACDCPFHELPPAATRRSFEVGHDLAGQRGGGLVLSRQGSLWILGRVGKQGLRVLVAKTLSRHSALQPRCEAALTPPL